MKGRYSRRKFLGASARALIAAGSFSALPLDLQARIRDENDSEVLEKGFSILQGLTTETTTQLSIDVPKDMVVHYRLVDFTNGRSVHPLRSVRAQRNFSSWAVDQVAFDGLELGVIYLFQVLDENGAIIDERELKTVNLELWNPRIAVLSCMMDFNLFKSKIWKNLENANPDYCFFIGDNVYGDLGGFKAGPKLLWRRYIETRKSIPFYRKRELTPVLALWDDHDFGKNNANHDYRHKVDSLDVFNSFFPRQPLEGIYETGPGVSSVFKAFHHDFLFIDNRYFRDTRVEGQDSFWGENQFSWIQKHVTSSSRPKWFLQGSQFFGAYQGKGQAFEGGKYEQQFDAVMNMIKKTNLPNLFLSGDVHFSEVQDIERSKTGYKTYEITASHMHSFTAKPKNNKRRRHLEADANFILIDLMKSAYGAIYEVKSVRRDDWLAFRDFLQVY